MVHESETWKQLLRRSGMKRLVTIAARATSTPAEAVCSVFKDLMVSGPSLSALALSLIVLGAADGNAMTLTVPDEFHSIQQAIESAQAGDTVEVKAGIYEEFLTFKDGIHLVGAGRQEVTIRGNANVTPILTVASCTAGTITGVTFEHNAEPADPARPRMLSLLLIESSSVELSRCAILKSPGAGLEATGVSSLFIRDCSITNNTENGILVTLKGGTALLEQNNCSGNKKSGIVVRSGKDAQVHIVGNRCHSNEGAGIVVDGSGSAPTLSRNDCSRNKSAGLRFLGGARGTAAENICEKNGEYGIGVMGEGTEPLLERNRCLANGGGGISFRQAAQGKAVSNFCDVNDKHGIEVRDKETGPTLMRNRCAANGWSGICFHSGALGFATANVCEANVWHGIQVEGNGTGPALEKNVCVRNGASGLLVRKQGVCRATENICNENTSHGVALVGCDPGTKLERNQCLKNGVHGVFFSEETWATGTGNDFTENGQICQGEIGWLFFNKEFEALEKIAKRLRGEKTHYPNGEWQLGWFYEYLVTGWQDVNLSDEKRYLEVLDQWRTAFPNSVTQRTALGNAYISLAWRARGSGWAYEVTSEGWEGFYANLNKAWDVLTEAEGLDEKDPALYAALVKTAMGLNKDESSAVGALVSRVLGSTPPASEIERAFQRGFQLEPSYYPLYYARAVSLLPRWRGRPGELEAFAGWAADATREQEGDALYALIAASALDYVRKEEFMNKMRFSWPRIKQGSQDILAAWPASSYRRNFFCLFACLYGDRATARQLFEEIGENWDNSVWRERGAFTAYKDWAHGKTERRPETTRFHVAIRDGDLKEALRLLEAGEDVNVRDSDGKAPIHIAVSEKNLDAVQLLLEHEADPNAAWQGVWTPLHLAIHNDVEEITNLLLEYGADHSQPRHGGWTPLHVAVHSGYAGVVRLLLEHGADPNLTLDNGTAPLHTAEEKGHPQIVEMLVEYGAEPSAVYTGERFALLRAVRAGQRDRVRTLVEKGANPNEELPSRGWTALHAAARQGDEETLRILLGVEGIDVNKADAQGDTPLHEAAAGGSKAAAELLLTSGADRNARNARGQTPLDRAREADRSSVVEVLAEHAGPE